MIERAKQLRQTATKAERTLWRMLHAKQMNGAKFRRQFVIDRYIADFCCLEARVVVETDGLSHDGHAAQDEQRQHFLESQGFVVLRFLDDDVMNRGADVADAILQCVELRLRAKKHPPPAPPVKGGE